MSIRILEIDTDREIVAPDAIREDYKTFRTKEYNWSSTLDIPGIKMIKLVLPDDVTCEWYEVWELPDGYTIF